MVQVRVPNTCLAALRHLKLAGQLEVLGQTMVVQATALLQPARHRVAQPGHQALSMHAAIQQSIGRKRGATGQCCPVGKKTPTDNFARPFENGEVQGVALNFDCTARWQPGLTATPHFHLHPHNGLRTHIFPVDPIKSAYDRDLPPPIKLQEAWNGVTGSAPLRDTAHTSWRITPTGPAGVEYWRRNGILQLSPSSRAMFPIAKGGTVHLHCPGEDLKFTSTSAAWIRLHYPAPPPLSVDFHQAPSLHGTITIELEGIGHQIWVAAAPVREMVTPIAPSLPTFVAQAPRTPATIVSLETWLKQQIPTKEATHDLVQRPNDVSDEAWRLAGVVASDIFAELVDNECPHLSSALALYVIQHIRREYRDHTHRNWNFRIMYAMLVLETAGIGDEMDRNMEQGQRLICEAKFCQQIRTQQTPIGIWAAGKSCFLKQRTRVPGSRAANGYCYNKCFIKMEAERETALRKLVQEVGDECDAELTHDRHTDHRQQRTGEAKTLGECSNNTGLCTRGGSATISAYTVHATWNVGFGPADRAQLCSRWGTPHAGHCHHGTSATQRPAAGQRTGR